MKKQGIWAQAALADWHDAKYPGCSRASKEMPMPPLTAAQQQEIAALADGAAQVWIAAGPAVAHKDATDWQVARRRWPGLAWYDDMPRLSFCDAFHQDGALYRAAWQYYIACFEARMTAR
jgi:hypothetical protein